MNKRRSFIALFLALATMASLAVTAVADGTDINNENTSVVTTVKNYTGMSFGKDAETGVSINGTLTPDTTYLFPAYVTDEDGNTTELTEDFMENHKVSFKASEGGSNISSMELVKKSGKYSLEVVTKRQWPTEAAEVEYTVKVSEKRSGRSVFSSDLAFEVAYKEIDDSVLAEAKDGDEVVVGNDAPVITKDQFDELDDLVNGGKVTFSNDDWNYEVKVTTQNSVNMLNNNKPIKDIVTKFEGNQFKFVNFPGGPEFQFSGKLTINVFDETEDFDNFYVYRYYKGTLTKIDAKFDKEEDTLSFNTKSLGNFVITDKEIKDGTVVDKEFGNSSNNGSSNGSTNGSTDNTDGDKTNPSTGSASALGAAAAMAVTAAAGVVLSKKNK